MSAKPELDLDSVKEKLLEANGIIYSAAKQLGRCRQTVSTFIKDHSLEQYLEECRNVRKDRSLQTLADMAFGEYTVEKVLADGSIVSFNPGPKYQALETQLKMDKQYTPRQENVDLDANTVSDLEKARAGWKE